MGGTPCFLVEWYRPEVSADDLDTIAASLDASAGSLRAEGSSVERLMLLAVPSDETVFAVFTAGSASDVHHACQRAGVNGIRLTSGLTRYALQA